MQLLVLVEVLEALKCLLDDGRDDHFVLNAALRFGLSQAHDVCARAAINDAHHNPQVALVYKGDELGHNVLVLGDAHDGDLLSDFSHTGVLELLQVDYLNSNQLSLVGPRSNALCVPDETEGALANNRAKFVCGCCRGPLRCLLDHYSLLL